MRYRKFVHALATAGVLVGLAGCGGYNDPNVGIGVSYVDRGPPRYPYEARGRGPGSGFVWMPGFYRYSGRNYMWVPGHWSAVQPGYRSWSPGRWRHSRQGWFWQDGRWR